MRRAYTLIEMLTTVAALIILLGLMVSLARRVRDRSADQLTRDLLVKLDTLTTQYMRRNDGQLPLATPLLEVDPAPDDAVLRRLALRNSADYVRAFRGQEDLSAGVFKDLSLANYDEVTLRDAWGSPIVLMPKMHPKIGMAPQNRFFFFSAGPDRKFLTRDDNLYSYEGR